VIWQVSTDDDGDLLLLELLHGDLEGICFPVQFDHDGCAHGDLEGSSAQNSGALVLGHVLGGDSLGLGDTSTPCSGGGYDLDVVRLLFLVDVLVHVLVNIIEVVAANAGIVSKIRLEEWYTGLLGLY